MGSYKERSLRKGSKCGSCGKHPCRCSHSRNISFIASVLTVAGIVAISGGLLLSQRPGIAQQDTHPECHHYVDGALKPESSFMSCDIAGCKYLEDGSYCTEKGCYLPDGTPQNGTPVWPDRHNIDWACRDANGNIMQQDDHTDAPNTCGNGIVESYEECDDGNTTWGDGCDSLCHKEPDSGGGSDCRDRAGYTSCVDAGGRMSDCENKHCFSDQGIVEPKCYKNADGALRWEHKVESGWFVAPKADCYDHGVRYPGDSWYPETHPAAGCKPGEEKIENDMECSCGTTGNWICQTLDTFKECRPGEEKREAHASCLCQEDGRWDCKMTGGDPDGGDNFEQEKQNMLRNFKQREREVKDMERQYKQSKSDDPKLKSMIQEFAQAIQNFHSCVERATSWDTYNTNCQDTQWKIDDLSQELWPRLNATNITRELENFQQRELKNMTKELERVAREGNDAAELKDILAKLESAVASVRNVLGSDPEEAQFLMQDVWELQREFWDAMQAINQVHQEKEIERQLGKGCEEFKREAKRLQHERVDDVRGEGGGVKAHGLVGQIQQLVNRCEELVRDAKSKLAGGAEPWEIEEDLRWAMEDLWREFEDIMQGQRKGQECRDAERGLKEASFGIEEEAPRMIGMLRETNPDVAEKMESLLQQAKTLLQKARAALDADDCEVVFDILDTMRFDIEERAMRLMEEAGMPTFMMDQMGPPRFVNADDDYASFYDEFGFEEDFMREFDKEDFMRHMGDRGYGMKDMGMMKKMPAGLMEEFFGNMKDMKGGPDLIRYASEAGIGDTQGIQDLIRVKNELLAEIKALKDQVAAIRSELADIVAQVQEYNFGRLTGKKAKEFVSQELPNLSREAAVAKLEELKSEARVEKFDDGVIPFVDTDDNEWYATHAAKAKRLGFVQGTGESGGKNLDPARDTNVAEAITMLARVEGINPDAVPVSDIGNRLPDWAKAAAGTLEQIGVDLDDIFEGKHPDDSATRAEVAELLDEVLDLPPVVHSGAADAFSDIGKADSDEKQAIAAVKEAGIMTGYGDSKAFGVDDPLNRAALVKILNLSANGRD